LIKSTSTTLQSDCPLIGGDSGGPLFDIEGTLVGIHSRVGFGKYDSRHVPMEDFLKSWDALKNDQFIGTGPFAEPRKPGSGGLDLTVKEFEGDLVIEEVLENGAAALAKIEAGSKLLEINGEPASKELLEKTLGKMTWGQRLTLKCQKDDDVAERDVILTKKEDEG